MKNNMMTQQMIQVLLHPEFNRAQKCEAAQNLGKLGKEAIGAVPALQSCLKDRTFDGGEVSYHMGGETSASYSNYLGVYAVTALSRIAPEACKGEAISAMCELIKYPVSFNTFIEGPEVRYISFPQDVVSAFGEEAVAQVAAAEKDREPGVVPRDAYPTDD